MKRVTILASTLASAALALLLGQACSSSDDSEQAADPLMGSGGSAGPVGSGGSAAAPAPGNTGATPAPGSGVAGAGGRSGSEGNPAVTPPAAGGSANASSGAMGGAAGSSMAAAAGAGGAPLAPAPVNALCPAVPSPSDGVACTLTCTDPCGVKNLGTRLCTCSAAVFDCATCEFEVEHPLLVPPTEPLADCALSDDLQEDDESGCTDNERCQSIGRTPGATDGGNRFCGCLDGSWDCDTKPASFGG
jgi:hypothetical protein